MNQQFTVSDFRLGSPSANQHYYSAYNRNMSMYCNDAADLANIGYCHLPYPGKNVHLKGDIDEKRARYNRIYQSQQMTECQSVPGKDYYLNIGTYPQHVGDAGMPMQRKHCNFDLNYPGHMHNSLSYLSSHYSGFTGGSSDTYTNFHHGSVRDHDMIPSFTNIDNGYISQASNAPQSSSHFAIHSSGMFVPSHCTDSDREHLWPNLKSTEVSEHEINTLVGRHYVQDSSQSQVIMSVDRAKTEVSKRPIENKGEENSDINITPLKINPDFIGNDMNVSASNDSHDKVTFESDGCDNVSHMDLSDNYDRVMYEKVRNCHNNVQNRGDKTLSHTCISSTVKYSQANTKSLDQDHTHSPKSFLQSCDNVNTVSSYRSDNLHTHTDTVCTISNHSVAKKICKNVTESSTSNAKHDTDKSLVQLDAVDNHSKLKKNCISKNIRQILKSNLCTDINGEENVPVSISNTKDVILSAVSTSISQRTRYKCAVANIAKETVEQRQNKTHHKKKKIQTTKKPVKLIGEKKEISAREEHCSVATKGKIQQSNIVFKGSNKCQQCDNEFATRHELVKHSQVEHGVKRPSPNTTFICEYCGKKLESQNVLCAHRSTEHGTNEVYRTHLCSVCGREFVSRITFHRHFRTHRKPVSCIISECPFKFSGKCEMEKHYKMVHLQEKKVQCKADNCDLMFAYKCAMEKHYEARHLKIKAIQCSWPACGKLFNRKCHLDVHMRIHNDLKPLKCNMCDYSCRQRAAMNYHMKKHASTEPATDDKNDRNLHTAKASESLVPKCAADNWMQMIPSIREKAENEQTNASLVNDSIIFTRNMDISRAEASPSVSEPSSTIAKSHTQTRTTDSNAQPISASNESSVGMNHDHAYFPTSLPPTMITQPFPNPSMPGSLQTALGLAHSFSNHSFPSTCNMHHQPFVDYTNYRPGYRYIQHQPTMFGYGDNLPEAHGFFHPAFGHSQQTKSTCNSVPGYSQMTSGYLSHLNLVTNQPKIDSYANTGIACNLPPTCSDESEINLIATRTSTYIDSQPSECTHVMTTTPASISLVSQPSVGLVQAQFITSCENTYVSNSTTTIPSSHPIAHTSASAISTSPHDATLSPYNSNWISSSKTSSTHSVNSIPQSLSQSVIDTALPIVPSESLSLNLGFSSEPLSNMSDYQVTCNDHLTHECISDPESLADNTSPVRPRDHICPSESQTIMIDRTTDKSDYTDTLVQRKPSQDAASHVAANVHIEAMASVKAFSVDTPDDLVSCGYPDRATSPQSTTMHLYWKVKKEGHAKNKPTSRAKTNIVAKQSAKLKKQNSIVKKCGKKSKPLKLILELDQTKPRKRSEQKLGLSMESETGAMSKVPKVNADHISEHFIVKRRRNLRGKTKGFKKIAKKVVPCGSGYDDFDYNAADEWLRKQSQNRKAQKKFKVKPVAYKCEHCSFTTTNRTDFKSHSFREHNVEIPCLNQYVCEFCGDTYSLLNPLRAHRATVHSTGESYLTYLCSFCGREFTQRNSYHTHVRWHKKSISCIVEGCPYKFVDNCHMKRHYRKTHLGQKTIPCKQEGCNKMFDTRSSMRRHYDTFHLKIRAFTCDWPECGKSFARTWHLKIHMRIHEDLKPLKCKYCDYTCRQKAALNHHMQKHPESGYTSPPKKHTKSATNRSPKGQTKALKMEHTVNSVSGESQSSLHQSTSTETTCMPSLPGTALHQAKSMPEDARWSSPHVAKDMPMHIQNKKNDLETQRLCQRQVSMYMALNGLE